MYAPTANGAMHTQMNEKRFRKREPLKRRHDLFLVEGHPGAQLALVSWGSTAGVCREALALAVDYTGQASGRVREECELALEECGPRAVPSTV